MKRITLLNERHYLLQLSKLYVLSMILVSDGDDHRYEACVPRNCGRGPNISFPFSIEGQQESYCGFGNGYPEFEINCGGHGYPVLRFSETEYVIEDIFYETRSFRVYNSLFFNSSGSNCLPRIRNTTIMNPPFDFADNVTNLHLFSNCSDSLLENPLSNISLCDASRVLALYGEHEEVENAAENCGTNLVAPIEDDGDIKSRNPVEVLRKGFVMNWMAADCSVCHKSGGYCGFNETTHLFKCFCPDRPHSERCKPGKKASSKLILVSGFGAVLGVASTLIFSLILRRRKKKNALNNRNIEVFLKHHQNLTPRRYGYTELKRMTNTFSCKLGQGGYGSVYKAKSKDGRLMAVKVLNESKNGGEFINEVASIGTTSHINIVTLMGFCVEGSKRALVYEFMPNGSLDKFIGKASSQKDQLGWEKLLEIVVGIARGLEYLHRGCQMQILHFDIKPHNILLDKDFLPKISDFGLAKLCPDRARSNVSMSGARGTVGYIAPELIFRNFGNASHKSDVYSYGMMVLDIAGERENTDTVTHITSEKCFPHWIYEHLASTSDQRIDDGAVEEDESRLMRRKLTIVGLWCVQTDPKERPSMSRVVEMLKGKLDSLTIPPKPYLSSSPRLAADDSFSESSLICMDSN